MKCKNSFTKCCLFILLMLWSISFCAAAGEDNVLQELSRGLSLETTRPHHYSDAIAVYQGIVTNNPDNPIVPFVQLRIGLSLSNMDQFGAAINELKKVVDSYDSTTCAPKALEMIAFVKTRDPNTTYEEQIAAFQAVIDRYPDSIQAKNDPTYIKNLTKRMTLMPTVEMRKALLPLFEDAWQYQPLGYRTRAVEDYNKILASDIANSACKAEAQMQKAGLIFEIAKGEDKQYQPTGTADRDRLLQQAREECKKVAQYDASLKQRAIADLMTVETYYFQGDYASAATWGEKYTEQYGPSFTWPDDKDVLTHIGNGKFTVGFAKYRAGDYRGAIKDYQDIISLWPEHPVCDRAQLEIARCYYELHEYSESVRAFKQLVATYPNSPFVSQAQESITNIERVFLSFLSAPVPRVYVQNVIHNSAPDMKLSAVNCGPVALKAVMDQLGIPADVQELSRLAGLNEKGTSLAGLAKAAQEEGLVAKGIQIESSDISSLKGALPVVVQLNYGQTHHFVALRKISNNGIEYSDFGKVQLMALTEFKQRFTGYALLFNGSDSRLFLSGRQMNSVIGTGVPPPPPPPINGNPPVPQAKTVDSTISSDGKPRAEGNSIDLTSGWVSHSGSVKTVSTEPIEWTHLSYDHIDGAGPGPFGYGTDWSYGDSLKDNGSEVIWNQYPLSKRVFTNNGTGYTAPKGVTARLVKNPNGTYTIQLKSGGKENFDSSGKLISLTDSKGNQNVCLYENNRLISVLEGPSQITHIYYDSSNRISAIQNPAGPSYQFEYSKNGDLVSQTDSLKQTLRYQYDGQHRVIQAVENNVTKNYSYDAAGKCSGIQSVDGNNPANNYSYAFGYDTVLYISWVIGSGNDTTYYVYNNRTWQTDVCISKGVTHTYVYDEAYNLISHTAAGKTTRYVWDDQRNLVSIINSN